MSYKRLRFTAIILFVLGLTGLQAQTMYVKESNGTQTAYALTGIQKISFSSGNLTVTKTDNNRVEYALNELMHLSFSENETVFDKPLLIQKQMLTAYPNPVSNVLNIDLKGETQLKGTLTLFNFYGKTLLTRQVTNEVFVSFDISYLPKGIYLCHYRTKTDLKTVIIIKQ